jgi:hypothetical protein
MAAYDEIDGRAQAAAWLDLLGGAGSSRQIVALPVLSGSMAPAVPPGATLEVVAAAWHTTRDGDIVIVRDGVALVAHRRLLGGRIGGRGAVYQKGDANLTGRWEPGERIVGVATGVRGADGVRIDLTTAAARAAARRSARESLAADLRHRLLAAPRRICAWLRTGTRNIG